jgi:hypothetical protein
VRIRTLSKRVRSADAAEGYEQLLKREGARWDENNHGRFSYDCLSGYLELVVAGGSESAELSPSTAEAFGKDFYRHPAFHFPSPDIVGGLHETMRAAFSDRLDLYGKPQGKTPGRLIPAFAAWHVAAEADGVVPGESWHRVSDVLNRHLLEPCRLPSLPNNIWASSGTVLGDVKVLWPRFINIQQFAVYPSHRH